MQRLRKFLREVGLEWKKVSKPTRNDISGSTIVVLIAVAISTIYLWAVDLILSQLRNIFIR